MWLRKMRGVPGSAPGGLEWPTVDHVVEVDDDLGSALLDIPDAGFAEAPPPAETESPDGAGEPSVESDGPAEVVEAPTGEEPDPAEVAEAPAKRKYTRRASTGQDTVTE